MEIVKIDLNHPSEESLGIVLKALMKEKVVAHPTDTCYGLAADIYSRKALKRLYQIKQMRFEKPVTFMVASLKQAMNYGVFNEQALALAEKYWPGALTLVLRRRDAVPDHFNEYTTTVGIRIPKDPFTFELIERLGKPVTTTSANLTGQPAAYSMEEIVDYFRRERIKPDLVVDAGKLENRLASTVVQILGNEIRVLRQGDINI